MPETIQNTKSEKLSNGSVVIKDSTGKIVKMLTGADAANYKDTGVTTIPTFLESQAQHVTQTPTEAQNAADQTAKLVNANDFNNDIFKTPTSNEDAQKIINSDQTKVSEGGTGEVNTRKTVNDYINEIKTKITPTTEKPSETKYVDTYKKYREDQGVGALEDQLNTLKAEQNTLLANKKARITSERGKAVATNVISGRISQVEQQENERLSSVNDSITNITNQLNTKYNTISTMMNLLQLDNAAATNRYNTEFSNNLTILNAANGLAQADRTEAQQNADNARANAQIVINTMVEGGMDYNALSDDQKTQLTKLGTESGLGANFFTGLLKSGNNKQILTTITSADDTKATIIYKDGTTKVIKTGLPAKSTGGTVTDSDQKIYYKQHMANALKSVAGADGYISQENWAKARQEWATSSPFTAEDFDNAFRGYINPKYAGTYAGFEDYNANFIKKTAAQTNAGI